MLKAELDFLIDVYRYFGGTAKILILKTLRQHFVDSAILTTARESHTLQHMLNEYIHSSKGNIFNQ